MLRTVKPRNARSKRALEARAPKEIEDPRTAIFVRATHTGEKINNVMKDLMALKRPNAIAFSKKNDIHPFTDSSSLDFWSSKNDASFFVVGLSTKKRPDGLILARMFDNKVLDMCELGVESYTPMSEFKTPKSTPGHRPLMHFASDLFDAHPRYVQLKSLLLDLFGADAIEGIHLKGIEHVISVSVAPTPSPTTLPSGEDDPASLPLVHLRTYTLQYMASGTRLPYAQLTPMGPFLDLRLRRTQPADPAVWALTMKRPKMKKKDVEAGLGKKRKNIEVDEMGDLRGRVHVARQDLSGLEGRRMKGLRGEEDDAGPRKRRRGKNLDDGSDE